MNDPWDVKSVRLSEQYVSCMKINGVPLLPPLLSKQCRKEMQYYKLLAKEVENRITHLKIINNECASSEDSLNGLEIPECEHSTPRQDKVYLDVEINKSTPSKATTANPNLTRCNNESPTKENLKLDKTRDNFDNAPKSPKNVALPIEIPERDCNNIKEQPEPPKKDVITDTEEIFPGQFEQKYNYDPVGLTDTLFHGPSSLSSKSFTGSLNDLHSEVKELDSVSKLVRQNSYTILQPSPQLMAHLQVQSQCTGMDIMSISMSESLSNLSSANKKRRSWDLETAKVKWSTMAMELKKKNLLPNSMKPAKTNSKSTRQTSPTRSKSQGGDKPTKQSPKTTPKSEPIQRPKKTPSNLLKSYPSDKTLTKADTLPKNKKDNKPKQETNTPKTSPIINQSEDPATKVRELYEKVQKQQLIQMANLIEKQKKEQMLLQKLFDEQQTMLLKQLKTICPESPKEVKQAWVNSQHDIDAGPVSLSQLIQTPTQKSPDQQIVDNAISSLQDTSKYIDHCDQILRKSKDLSHSIKKHTQSKSGIKNGSTQSTGLLTDGSITRQVSPVLSGRRSTPASRKLNYETSASYDHDYDPMFTDRTNDTFADLNVTFPSDSDDFHLNNTVINNKSTSYDERSATSIDSAIINMQEKIKKSIRDVNTRPIVASRSPTDSELAAATKITAFARGYLVRRLLRTERVQGTVQTIKDALLCALQLHQDREGIRGADVDLHRRLIQQITAACYCLHDTFVVSTPAERCAMIAADRAKRRASAAKPPPMTRHYRPTDAMSLSHTGAFPSRVKRQMSTPLSQSTYETFSNSPKGSTCSSSYARGPPRRPWR